MSPANSTHDNFDFEHHLPTSKDSNRMTALQTALAPFTLKGFYLLTWGTTLGANVWNTVVSSRLFRSAWHFYADGDMKLPQSCQRHRRHADAIVRLPHIQDPPSGHLRYPPIPAHTPLLLILHPLLGRFAAYAPLLPPRPHLVLVLLWPPQLAVLGGRPTGSLDPRRAGPPGGQLVLCRTKGDREDVCEAQAGEDGGQVV